MSTARKTGRRLTEVPAVPEALALPPLRRMTVPVQEPRAASRVTSRRDQRPPATQGTLALALNNDEEDVTEAAHEAPDPVGLQPASLVGLLPDPEPWAAAFAQAAMEVSSGLRSAGQLIRWTTPDVHATLVRRGSLTARARRSGSPVGSKPRLRALLACTPRPGICEIAAVISEPERVRAVAFRMEGLHGRWRVTHIEIG